MCLTFRSSDRNNLPFKGRSFASIIEKMQSRDGVLTRRFVSFPLVRKRDLYFIPQRHGMRELVISKSMVTGGNNPFNSVVLTITSKKFCNFEFNQRYC